MELTVHIPRRNLSVPNRRAEPKRKANRGRVDSKVAGVLLFAQLLGPSIGAAATIWTGPRITFSKADGADPTLAANQDRMTANVWITRGSAQGIYNAKSEGSFTHFLSPTNTEWANGTTANYSSLTYSDWNSWAKGVNAGPPSTVGVNAVVHLKSDDIYLDLKFLSWNSSGVGGGFSYSRSTAAASNNPPSVTITNPINNATFIDPANVTIQASASDSDGSVTNVQFFDGAASLGNVSSSPFQLLANLALGQHALTAVASDNLGLRTTSAPPVTVTIITNARPSVAITNPPDGSAFHAPGAFAIEASAEDSDGSIASVQFYNGAASLGTLTASPYTVTVSNLAAGSYTFSAVATDNLNAMATNNITVTVTNTAPPSAVTIPNSALAFAGRAFGFAFQTQTGYTYSVDFTISLNPIVWSTMTNFIGDGSMAQFTDFTPTNAIRYYRVGVR